MSVPGPVLLLDTASLLFRSFYALPPMTTSTGVPTAGLYGLCTVLLKLWREQSPQGLAFAVDLPVPTDRSRSFPAYKAHRPPVPDPLREQLRRLPTLFEALGVPAHGVPGLEADDVLATLAAPLRRAGVPTLIVSGDTDLLQLAHGSVDVWFVGRRQKDAVRYDEAAVRARYGIAPTQLPAWKALHGDPSDNLPGVPGVGKVGASRLVAAHGDVAGVLAAAQSVRPARVQAALLADAEAWLLHERLATLRDDLGLDTPHWSPLTEASRDGLVAWFEALEFRSLVGRVQALGR